MLSTTIKDFKNLATTIYDTDKVPSTILTLVGESGIGKTESCLQFVKELKGYEREARIINVAHLNIEDMGMPTVNGDDYAKFKLSDIFRVESGKNVLILLDELNRPNNESVINFLLGAVNERRLFGHLLPDEIRFMATMNPNNEHYVETQDIFADIAARRRFNLIEILFDPAEFIQYSTDIGMDDTLLSFLTQNIDQILIPGKLNCPRQWHRFHHDILTAKDRSLEHLSQLKLASSLYMDTATLRLWMKYWAGNLEKYIRAKEIMAMSKKTHKTLLDHVKKNKIDLLSATADELRSHIKSMKNLKNKTHLANIKTFLLAIPKSLAFTIIEDTLQNGDCRVDLKKYFYNQQELMDLIISGTS